MLTDHTEGAQTLSLDGRNTSISILFLRKFSSYDHVIRRIKEMILCLLTVCLIIGALCLFPAAGFGCLSIDAGTGFFSDSTIGSLSLK